jgi:hypothetical protein
MPVGESRLVIGESRDSWPDVFIGSTEKSVSRVGIIWHSSEINHQLELRSEVKVDRKSLPEDTENFVNL